MHTSEIHNKILVLFNHKHFFLIIQTSGNFNTRADGLVTHVYTNFENRRNSIHTGAYTMTPYQTENPSTTNLEI